jgi:glycosyltransferase involved in cell wall biosynthesis
VKKLLVVANYFPPMASGGIARQLRFLRYLPDTGWEPTVLSCKAKGPVPDPPGVRIVRAAAPGPESAYALARRLRPTRAPGDGPGGEAVKPGPSPGSPPAAAGGGDGLSAGEQRFGRRAAINTWLFVPDQYMGWIGPGIAKGRRLLADERYDAIFSSYPRGSTHLIAAALARSSGLPWLADYRDPWPTHQFRRYPTPLHRRAHFALERWALAVASMATATNEPIADDLRRRYPRLAGRVEVLPNGFDRAEDVDDIDLGDGFWLVHTGRLYSRGAKAERLLAALADLPDDVKMLFVGVDGPALMTKAAALGIADRVRVEPFVQRPRALGFQRAADALVLITGDAPEALSSKIFEYLVAGKPVFAVTPSYSCAAALLDEVGGGQRAAAGRPLTASLAEFVSAVRAGTLGAADQSLVARYDGRTLTEQLAGYLETIVAEKRR